MITLDQSRTKRLFAVHGWSGTVLGLLLYAVVLTGAVAVFAHEIGHWSKGGSGAESYLHGRIHKPLTDHALRLDPSFLEHVRVQARHDGTVRLTYFRHQRREETGQIEDFGHVVYIDPSTGETLEQKTGYVRDLLLNDPKAALERFLIDLHVRLYVPEPWGLFLTGILGLAMLVAAVSGLLMHRHLIRDLFTAPRARGLISDRRDRHVLAAAWGLPFSILLAFTGAFFSFALSIGLPLVAMVAFGGDRQAVIEHVVGVSVAPDTTASLPASLDYIIMDSAARAGAPPTFMQIDHFGTTGALVTTSHGYAGGEVTRKTLMFDGATRAYLGEKPTLGTTPSAGSAAVSLMAPLHFGDFAGLASKSVWFALGLAMSFVIATGMQMWVHRRNAERIWRRFGRAVEITVWGLPVALLGSAVAFFLALPAGSTMWWTPAGFVIAALAAVWLGLRADDPRETYRPAAAVLCLGLPVLRHLVGGTSWSEAIMGGHAAVLTIDLLLICAGLVLLKLRTSAVLGGRRALQGPAE